MEKDIKLKTKRPEELGVEAYKLGCALGNFSEWLNALPAEQRSKRGMPQMLMDSYKKGVEHWTDENNHVNRMCVFIEDQTGKFYNRCADVLPGVYKADSKKALSGLASHHKTLLTNELFVGKLVLPLSENTVKDVNQNYRWTGDLMVVVVPYGFNQWLKKCGVKYAMKTNMKPAQQETLAALQNRFIICRVEDDELQLVSQLSLDAENQRFYDFQKKVNAYHPVDNGFNLRVKTVTRQKDESISKNLQAEE